ncbi:MAG: ABC transporter permease [Gammaproteobacteria bacterium]|nr:ABC transporter permease [Gammaproteobacteria bacterium]
MESSIPEISLLKLIVAFVPVAVAIVILVRYSLGAWNGVYATARMLIQLLVIGYVLTYIFNADQPYVVLAVLLVMMAVASWIALRPLGRRTPSRYAIAFAAVAVSGLLTLILVTQGVLSLDPWYDPRYAIPLGGMIFSAAMNAVSLAAERYDAELATGTAPAEALPTALNAALIPQVNTLFAVGLVALPGMMTGQILAGVEPLIAVRYQIVVMCMLFGVTALSAAAYLVLAGRFAIATAHGRRA